MSTVAAGLPIDVRGIIFDLDGTLFDSMPYWENLGEDYLRSRGKTPAPDIEDVSCTNNPAKTETTFIVTHNYVGANVDIKPEAQMEKVLFAADELTGLIGAAAIMRPSKSTKDIRVAPVTPMP